MIMSVPPVALKKVNRSLQQATEIIHLVWQFSIPQVITFSARVTARTKQNATFTKKNKKNNQIKQTGR